MTPPAPRKWLVYVVAALAVLLAAAAVNGALRWYGHAFAEVFVDPDAVVSGIGSPSWEGMRQGLRYPDQVQAVDGEEVLPARDGFAARTWDAAVERAAAAGRDAVSVRVATVSGVRTIDLPVRQLGASEWWLLAGVPFISAGLYVLAALTALIASPSGPLARTFAKTALACALFLFTFFDFHTSRDLVNLWECALAMAPFGFVGLALRLPDDAGILRRFPWAIRALDTVGLALAVAMLAMNAMHQPTVPIRSICSVLLAASQIFFAATFIVRFFRSKGERRGVMRALVAAVAPPHALLGVAIILSMLTSRGSTAAFYVALPILSLLPMSAVVAFIRHDLWGSRALVSRVLTLTTAAVVACVIAIALGAAFAASVGIPFRHALLGALAGSLASAALVTLALRVSDQGFFPSRAGYKPTIEQLSEDLTSLLRPDEVASAVERTVKKWLPCDYVEFVERDEAGRAAGRVAEHELNVSFRGATIGVLRVGKKRGGALFTSDDLDLLRTIANQAALALAFAHSYRELEERRRQQAAAWRGERLALIETVAAEIAHEVRYPINFFRSVFRRGSTELDPEEIEIGVEEVDRLERLVSGLRRVAPHKLERRTILVAELAARAEVLLRDALGTRKLHVDVAAGVALRCDVDQTTQILVNLIANALDATEDGGEVGVAFSRLEAGGEIAVWDTGPGFEGDVAQLFAPWFTTKPRGTGLGLAITQRIVRAHGWSIDARRERDETRFVVVVPAADIVVERAPEQPALLG